MSEHKDKYNFKDIKHLIDINIYKFLLLLLKKIFVIKKFFSKTKECSDKFDKFIKKINEKIIKDKNSYINEVCTEKNLNNILKFVKSQNKLFASEIVENLLIITFSFIFKTDKVNTFGQYIFNNLNKLKNENKDLAEWFNFNEFSDQKHNLNIKTKEDMEKVLENDIVIENKKRPTKNNFQKDFPLYDFLIELYFEKYYNSKKYFSYKKFLSYINLEKKYSEENKVKGAKYELDSKFTIYTSIFNDQIYTNEIGRGNRCPIPILKSFLISVYIYYQNKHSPLMKYIKQEENNDLEVIPFTYDLKGADLNPEYAGIVMAPSRIEPRITKLDLGNNVLKEKGLLELSKTLLFNKNIKIIDLKRGALKSNQLFTFNEGLGLFDNYSVEELEMSLNYIKNNSEANLFKILSHLKGLKTINFTSNFIKDGISSFLIMLKKLYREKKINLENLILNKCFLDNISFYELGELLKSKYCKLKNLYLNNNNKIPPNFLKKLKKNNSLTEIYINECNLTNNNLDDIMRLISNTNIESLYLYKNKFNNLDDCLKIIYRTKLVLDQDEQKREIIHEDSLLYNLDLSLNDCYYKNIEQIELIKNFLDNTTLYVLDLSYILFGRNPNIVLKKDEKNDYEKKVYELKDKIDEDGRIYKKIFGDINSYKVDLDNLKKYDDENFKKFDDKISHLIIDSNSIYPLFLKDQARKLIFENKDILVEYKDKKELLDKLVKYINLKRIVDKLKSLEKKTKKMKLILI